MLGKEESLGKYQNIYDTFRTAAELTFPSDTRLPVHCVSTFINLLSGPPKRRLLVETTLRQSRQLKKSSKKRKLVQKLTMMCLEA